MAAYFLMSKANAAGNLNFFPGTITSAGVQGQAGVMQITVIAQNTSGTALQLNSFAGNVYSNGTLIGNVSNFLGVSVPANSQVPIPLTVQLLPVGIVSDIINSFTNGTAIQNITLDGKANVNNIQVSVPLAYSLNV